MRTAAVILIVLAISARAAAQQAATERLDPMQFGVVYEVPETDDVRLEPDVPYFRGEHGALTIDVYSPPKAKRGEKRAAVVFLNAIGDSLQPGEVKLKHWGIYRTWPRLIAALGMVGISMESDPDRVQESLASLFEFLAQHGAEHGIDAERLGVYAASANVSGACEYLLGSKAAPGIRAAALYYGAPPAQPLRNDLPVLFVVAESDVPRMSGELAQLWPKVLQAHAPWQLLHGSGLCHAFDAFADTDDSRRVIQETIAFWRAHLEPLPQPAEPPSEARAIAAALFGNDLRTATVLLKSWVADHPDDAEGHAQYGRVLAESGRFREAGQAYERAVALGNSDPDVCAGLGLVRVGESRWKEAADLLGRAVAAGTDDSRVLGGLGYAQLMLGKTAEGVQSYERALAAGIPPGAQTRGLACFNLACGYARLGKKDEAFQKLGMAIDEGFKERKRFESDADLATLRSDPRFQSLAQRLTSQ